VFGAMFSTSLATARTSRAGWLQAMLDFEAALAGAEADAGLIPVRAAEDIAAHCRAELFDAESIEQRAAGSATPVIALVSDLGSLVATDSGPFVHRGATSQDVVDTAAMLIARDVLDPVLADLRAAAEHCAQLAREHRGTVLIARSLLQQALPSTFGLRCAGWLTSLDEAIAALERVRRRLAVQFGGAAGTLASLGSEGPRVLAALAERLELGEPVLPWHTDRTRIAELAGALATATGALGKIALDVQLHAQTEVGELTEGAPGGSSAMPHKQNPVSSVLITAAADRVPGLVSTLLAAMPQPYERAAGAWQSEWEPLGELLRLAASASERARAMLADLRVHPGRMTANLELTGGLVLAENAAGKLMHAMGRGAAQQLVAELCKRAVRDGTALRTVLLTEPRVRSVLSEAEVRQATDPADYLGAAGDFVDRALAAHAEREDC
jgi:3-carboxy-cis,cis-muconate cycloisomerase